jgi:hypothetical protein
MQNRIATLAYAVVLMLEVSCPGALQETGAQPTLSARAAAA